MTQVHFTLNSEKDQSTIEHLIKDDVSKNILSTVFNQLMETSEQNTFKLMITNDPTIIRVKEMNTMSEILRLVYEHLN